jgi:hypothetical protein
MALWWVGCRPTDNAGCVSKSDGYYAVITVNPQRCPTAKAELADRFGQW